MKSIITFAAAAALSIGLAGTASATSPGAEIGLQVSKQSSIAPVACYYQYTWIGNYYMRQLVCF